MSTPLQVASLYDDKEVFVGSDCLLNLVQTSSLVFPWDTLHEMRSEMKTNKQASQQSERVIVYDEKKNKNKKNKKNFKMAANGAWYLNTIFKTNTLFVSGIWFEAGVYTYQSTAYSTTVRRKACATVTVGGGVWSERNPPRKILSKTHRKPMTSYRETRG